MPDSILVNGYDLAGLGFHAPQIDSHLAAPGRSYAISEIPERDDALLLSEGGTPQARRIQVNGWLQAPDRATLRLYADRFKGRLRGGALEVIFPDEPGRFIRGRAEQVTLPPIPPVFSQRAIYANFALVCPDPHYYDLTTQTVAIGAGAAQIALGSAPVRPIITLTSGTGPVIIYRDAAGVARARMDFTGTSIGTGASLVIDTHRMTIRTGAGVNMANALISPSRWIVLDPYHAAGPAGPWPTVEVTNGAGEIRYRRAWL